MAGLTRALDERLVRIESVMVVQGERLARIEERMSELCRLRVLSGGGRPRDVAVLVGSVIGGAMAAGVAVAQVMAR